MPAFSEQKIVVICDFSERMIDVIAHGARMAEILNKELCLVALWKDKKQKSRVHEKISATTRTLKSNLPNQTISCLLLQGTLQENMGKLAESYHAILIILHQADIKAGLKAFRESTIAFLFVNGKSPEFLTYKNVLVPVDFRKASKEATLWASYLGRFNRSLVHLVYAHETNSDQAAAIMQNLSFMQKLLSNLKVSFEFSEGKSGSWGIFGETLREAATWKGDVMIFAGSTYISLIDRMIGLPEEKIVKRAGLLPILIINPLREVCVLCD